MSNSQMSGDPNAALSAQDQEAASGFPNAFTSFLIVTAVGYVGLLLFVFTFGLYGDELTAGVDLACAEAAFQNGKQVESKGNYELAIQRYRQALEGRFADKAREYECGRSIGEVLLRLGRYEEAVEAYRSLPGDAFTQAGHWTGYVTSLLRAGQYQEAERLGGEWLQKAQTAGDKQQIIWANATMGQIMEHLDRLDDACNYYRVAANEAPDGDATIMMANVLRKLDRTAEAMEALDKYLARTNPGPLHEEAKRLRAEFAASPK